MTENAIRAWLSAYELNAEQSVFANLVLILAAEVDEKKHTSTIAELRKTVEKLSSLLAPNHAEYDPLGELLKR